MNEKVCCGPLVGDLGSPHEHKLKQRQFENSKNALSKDETYLREIWWESPISARFNAYFHEKIWKE